jgi:hypothetical protein
MKSNKVKTSAAPVADTSQFAVVKAIKNSLFKTVQVGESVKLAGLILNTELDEGNFGTFTRFLGQFRANVGGQIIMAGKLYVPSVAESLLVGAYSAQVEAYLLAHEDVRPLDTDKDEDRANKRSRFLKGFPGVEFGIYLEKVEDLSPNNALKFQWVVKPLLDMKAPADKYLALVAG